MTEPSTTPRAMVRSTLPDGRAASRRAREWIDARYELINHLGSGSTGTIDRALDRLSGRVVTVKRLLQHDDHLRRPMGGMLAQEFRLLASIRHPNVIGVLDYGSDRDGRPFFVMDLEEGARTIVEAGRDAPLAVQLDLLAQMLRALAYLHRIGVVHRDVKPENVLVVRGQVKLLDFGLAVATDAARSYGIAGTPLYMAPETLLGATPTPKSDLYGAGMVAYELIRGSHPFDGRSPLRVHELMTTACLPLPDDGLDPRARTILGRWLAPVATRYASAPEVIRDLDAAFGTPLPVETIATRESCIQAARMVGRDIELVTLASALEAARRGAGSAWLLAGESGVGKSRILDEFRIRALAGGSLVVRGHAVNLGGAPYQPWREVLAELALRADVDEGHLQVLATIAPGLADVVGRPIDAPPAVAAESAQSRLVVAIEHLLRVQGCPVVIILEDLHWAGSESLELLARLARSVDGMASMMVGSFRQDEPPRVAAAVPEARLLPVPRLTRNEIDLLVTSMIGHARSDAAFVDFLERQTEGIPFFVVEVMRALAEATGSLDRVPAAYASLPVSSGGMQKVVRARLHRVPAGALAALHTAAVIGRQIDERLLEQLHPEMEVGAWTTACADVAVLDVRDQRWMFAHDKLREQLLADMPAATRRALHQRVGTALETEYGDDPSRAAALAMHWAEAGDEVREARYAHAAGQFALRNDAFQEAIVLLDRAATLVRASPDGAPSRSRRAGLAGLVDPNANIDVGSAACTLGRIEAGLSEAYYRLGDLKTCREHSERALEHFGMRVPGHRVQWTVSVGREMAVRALQRLLGRDGHHGTSAREVASEIAHVHLRLTDTFFYSGDLTGIVWSSLRVVNQCEPTGPSPALARGYVILALLASASRATRIADAWAARALMLAKASQSDRDLAWVRSRLVVHALQECRFDEVDTHVMDAGALAERLGDMRLWEEVRVLQAMRALYSARFDVARALFQDLYALTRRSGNRQVECWAILGEGMAASRQGDDEATVELEQRALSMIDEQSMRTEAICSLAALGVARLRLGDPAGAFAAAERAIAHIAATPPVAYWLQQSIAAACEVMLLLVERRWRPQSPTASTPQALAALAVGSMRRFARHVPLGRPQACLWNGLQAWTAGNHGRARRSWNRAIELAQHYGCHYERGRAHLEIGRHLAAGDADRARHLRIAEDLFADVGATHDLGWTRSLGESPQTHLVSQACI